MLKNSILNEIIENEKLNPTRISEVEEKVMAHGEISMRYSLEIIGEIENGGYSVYIALHGGGQSDTPELNDSQWEIMKTYYRGSVKSGIYIAPRGIRDTWNTHFNPESYYFYRRLIQNMIIFYGANPNKIYLLGYSAGGDGVYQITSRMADFFAAANMSAGHPNGVDLTNVKNMKLYIQCGENDSAYNRNEETVRYGKNENVEAAFLHKGKGHQIRDNSIDDQQMTDNSVCDTNAIRLISRHERNPYPKNITWNLSLKEDDLFYYIESDKNEGFVSVKFDDNNFTVEGEATYLYMNEDFVDYERDVVIIHNGKKTTVKPVFDENVLRETFEKRFDKYLTFTYKVNLKEI
jgi:predicted esterase